MKKLVFVLASALIAGLAFSDGSPENFGGNGEAFVNDYGEHYINVKGPQEGGQAALRFDWANQRWVIPSDAAGLHAGDKNPVVERHGDDTLIDPRDTYPD